MVDESHSEREDKPARGALLPNGRLVLAPLPEEDDLTYWKHAGLEERGRALADLLGLADAIGHFPPKPELPQVFPRLGERSAGPNFHAGTGATRPVPSPGEGARRVGLGKQMLRFIDRVAMIAAALDSARIPYAFGGAIAYGYYGELRATRDIDINVFLRETEGLPVLGPLASIGFAIDVERDVALIRRDGQVRLRWDDVPVALFFATFAFLDACRDRVRPVRFEGRQIPILSPEDLVVYKIAFNREKDWLDLRQMVAIRGERLDVGHIRRWLHEILGADDPRTRRFESLIRTA